VRTVLYLRKDSNYTPFLGASRRWGNYNKRKALVEKLQMWDDTLNMSFMETRQALADIASDNYSSLGADVILNYNDQWCYDFMKTIGDGWVLPVDDDDWLPDGILDKIRVLPNAEMYWWNSLSVACFVSDAEVRRSHDPYAIPFPPDAAPSEISGAMWYKRRRLPRKRRRRMVTACCYAMPIQTANKEVLDKHAFTSKIRGNQIDAVSCYISHPAGITSMCTRTHTVQDLLLHIDRMRHFDEEAMPRPEFKRKMKMLKELFTEIKPKKIIVNMK
jgi:hypothetical protein